MSALICIVLICFAQLSSIRGLTCPTGTTITDYSITADSDLESGSNTKAQNVTLQQCQSYCTMNALVGGLAYDCGSFSYQAITQQCTLYTGPFAASGIRIIDSVGTIFYQKICADDPAASTSTMASSTAGTSSPPVPTMASSPAQQTAGSSSTSAPSTTVIGSSSTTAPAPTTVVGSSSTAAPSTTLIGSSSTAVPTIGSSSTTTAFSSTTTSASSIAAGSSSTTAGVVSGSSSTAATPSSGTIVVPAPTIGVMPPVGTRISGSRISRSLRF